MENRDQWKFDGNCDACRRQKYCSTYCLKKKTAIRKEQQEKAERDRKIYEALMKSIKEKAEQEKTEENTEPAKVGEDYTVE